MSANLEQRLRVTGLVGLSATKAADISLTIAVLAAAPRAEMNPLAALAWRTASALGVIAVGVVMIAVIAVGTELGVAALRDLGYDRRERLLCRLVGYGIPILMWVFVAIRNAREITEVIA